MANIHKSFLRRCGLHYTHRHTQVLKLLFEPYSYRLHTILFKVSNDKMACNKAFVKLLKPTRK